MMEIWSPITHSKHVEFEKIIDIQKLKAEYLKQLNFDISHLLNDISNLALYKCKDTDVHFFNPEVIGDSNFYEHLQKLDWYYMPWKWEHESALRYISPKIKVLEVGCGKGSFLKKIKKSKNIDVTGLELNKSVVNNENYILNETIEEHSKSHVATYDVVCSFQVLEHIPEIKEFIDSQLKVLKKRGKLIISVPNNDSFLKYSYNILNMPPHHFSLWNKKSFKILEKYFPIILENLFFEPLQHYHKEYFLNTTIKHLNKKYHIPIRILNRFSNFFILFSSKKYKAFTIQAVFTKI